MTSTTPAFVAYYTDLALDSGADATFTACGVTVSVFFPTQADQRAFAALRGVEAVCLSSEGAVCMTRLALEVLRQAARQDAQMTELHAAYDAEFSKAALARRRTFRKSRIVRAGGELFGHSEGFASRHTGISAHRHSDGLAPHPCVGEMRTMADREKEFTAQLLNDRNRERDIALLAECILEHLVNPEPGLEEPDGGLGFVVINSGDFFPGEAGDAFDWVFENMSAEGAERTDDARAAERIYDRLDEYFEALVGFAHLAVERRLLNALRAADPSALAALRTAR